MGILSERSKTAKVASLNHSDFYAVAAGLRSTLIVHPVRAIAERAGNKMSAAVLTSSTTCTCGDAPSDMNLVVMMSRNAAKT